MLNLRQVHFSFVSRQSNLVYSSKPGPISKIAVLAKKLSNLRESSYQTPWFTKLEAPQPRPPDGSWTQLSGPTPCPRTSPRMSDRPLPGLTNPRIEGSTTMGRPWSEEGLRISSVGGGPVVGKSAEAALKLALDTG